MNQQPRQTETWRERRLTEKQARQRKTINRDNGCCCDTGPLITATWRNSQLTVALEHRPYCPIQPIAYNPDVYATTGQRIPL